MQNTNKILVASIVIFLLLAIWVPPYQNEFFATALVGFGLALFKKGFEDDL